MKQLLTFKRSATSSLNTSGTDYYPIYDGGTYSAGVESIAAQTIPIAGTIRNLIVDLNTAPGGSASRTISIYINGVSQFSVSYASGDSGIKTDTTSYIVSAGDTISVESSMVNTAASSRAKISLEFEPTTTNKYVTMGVNTASLASTATRYFPVCFTTIISTMSRAGYTSHPMPHSATLTDFYIQIQTAPGVGASWDFQVMKNGFAVGSAITISDTAVSGSVTGMSVLFTQNDIIDIRSVPTNSPATSGVSKNSLAFTSGNNTDYAIFGSGSGISSSSTEYLTFASASASSTEYLVDFLNNVTLSNFSAYLETTPGSGKSFSITFRKNQIDTSAAITISDFSKLGNDNTDTISLVSGDTISASVVPSGSPSSGDLMISAVASYNPVTDTTVTPSVLSATSSVQSPNNQLSYLASALSSTSSTQASTSQVITATNEITAASILNTSSYNSIVGADTITATSSVQLPTSHLKYLSSVLSSNSSAQAPTSQVIPTITEFTVNSVLNNPSYDFIIGISQLSAASQVQQPVSAVDVIISSLDAQSTIQAPTISAGASVAVSVAVLEAGASVQSVLLSNTLQINTQQAQSSTQLITKIASVQTNPQSTHSTVQNSQIGNSIDVDTITAQSTVIEPTETVLFIGSPIEAISVLNDVLFPNDTSAKSILVGIRNMGTQVAITRIDGKTVGITRK